MGLPGDFRTFASQAECDRTQLFASGILMAWGLDTGAARSYSGRSHTPPLLVTSRQTLPDSTGSADTGLLRGGSGVGEGTRSGQGHV